MPVDFISVEVAKEFWSLQLIRLSFEAYNLNLEFELHLNIASLRMRCVTGRNNFV